MAVIKIVPMPIATTGATGTFTSIDGKLITVTNGIIVSIEEII